MLLANITFINHCVCKPCCPATQKWGVAAQQHFYGKAAFGNMSIEKVASEQHVFKTIVIR